MELQEKDDSTFADQNVPWGTIFFLHTCTRFSVFFIRSGYFRPVPHAWRQDVVDRIRTEHFWSNTYLFQRKIDKTTHIQAYIQSSDEE